MTRGIIKFLVMGMFLGPIGILVGSGGASAGLALTVGFGFVVWIVVAYVITKPIELAIKNKDKIKKMIKNNTLNSNQQESNNANTQKQKDTQIMTNLHTENNNNLTSQLKQKNKEKKMTEIDKDKYINNINITEDEEEEIYAKISQEVDSENKKEGIWTKSLVLSEGDDSKARIEYIKLRVAKLKGELNESKTELEKERLLIIQKENDEIQKENDEKENEIKKVRLFFEKHFGKRDSYNSVGTINLLNFLIEEAKKNKIESYQFISTSHIKFMIDNYHYKPKNDKFLELYDKLNKIVINSNSKVINVSLVEKIYNEYRWE